MGVTACSRPPPSAVFFTPDHVKLFTHRLHTRQLPVFMVPRQKRLSCRSPFGVLPFSNSLARFSKDSGQESRPGERKVAPYLRSSSTPLANSWGWLAQSRHHSP